MKNIFESEPEIFKKYMLGFSCYFDDPLSFYFRLGRYKFFLQYLQSSDSVLELGCGEGMGTYMFASKAQSITAVDIEKDLIDYAKANFSNDKIDYHCQNVLDVDFNKKFNVIIASDIHEYLDNPQTTLFHKMIVRHLKNDGEFFLSVPNRFSQTFATERRVNTHVKEYYAEELEQELLNYFSRVIVYHKTDEYILPAFPKNAYNLVAHCSGIKHLP